MVVARIVERKVKEDIRIGIKDIRIGIKDIITIGIKDIIRIGIRYHRFISI